MFKDIISRKNIFILFMAILLLPLLFINVKNSHDWGGDFAMYIMQARNIVNGISQTEIPYIYNPENAVVGPPAYFIGFPLILSPVYAIFGNSIYAFTLCVSVFLFLVGLIMVMYLRQYFSNLIVFFLVLIVVYNPWTINMKMEIMSEFPFTFILLLLVYLFNKYPKKSLWLAMIVSVLMGFLISIRVIGIVFPIAVLLFTIYKIATGNRKKTISIYKYDLLIPFASILIFWLLNNLFFTVPQAKNGSYSDIWANGELFSTVLYNLGYYTEQFKYFFSPWGGDWNFLQLILKAIIFTFTIVGMLKQFTKKLELFDFIVVLYFGVLLTYPYHHSGIRFLFPIMPFLLIYLVKGLQSITIYESVNHTVKIVIMGSLVLVSYTTVLSHILRTQNQIIVGPQENTAIDAFKFINENTDANSVIMFAKPRVLALYTNRQSIADNNKSNTKETTKLIRKYDVDYILIQNELSRDAIKKYVGKQKNIVKVYWSNNKFKLYKIID